ncbi:hypothetical protein [Bifidobacterium pseudolongum]|uniref:hypothetical protein n=1 Tax=Bifidobacterium pseudolongum TaxID=1694 RepID=UPI0010212E25|nr:hypothetical protein [Bifidobacterium pseudolongum]
MDNSNDDSNKVTHKGEKEKVLRSSLRKSWGVLVGMIVAGIVLCIVLVILKPRVDPTIYISVVATLASLLGLIAYCLENISLKGGHVKQDKLEKRREVVFWMNFSSLEIVLVTGVAQIWNTMHPAIVIWN